MHQIDIKPLTVNQAWQGKRFKTPLYRRYRDDVSLLLPKDIEIPKEGRLALELIVGLSNSNADIDNILKPFIDCLQDKYGFNDNRIYKLDVEKQIVKKSKEFIKFNFRAYKADS